MNTEDLMTKAADARQRIAEQNKYRPSSLQSAYRGYVKAHKGLFQPTVKLPGDKVIDERGHCHEIL